MSEPLLFQQCGGLTASSSHHHHALLHYEEKRSNLREMELDLKVLERGQREKLLFFFIY
jgi:hypothetical protein